MDAFQPAGPLDLLNVFQVAVGRIDLGVTELRTI